MAVNARADKVAHLSHFIDGHFVSTARRRFENRHPATGAIVNLVPEADSAVIDDAVKRRSAP